MAKKHKAAAPANEGKKAGKIEIIGNALIGACAKTGSRRLETWARAYFRPEETLPSLDRRAGVKETIFNLLHFYFPYYVIVFAMYSASFYVLGAQPVIGDGIKHPLDPSFIAGIIIVEPLLNTLNMLVVMLLLFVPARFLGGKAGYARQSYAISNLFAGWMALLTAIMVAATLELAAGSLFRTNSILDMALSFGAGLALLATLLAGLAAFVYGFYQLYRIIKAVHGLDGLRAAGAMICATILVVALNVALMFLLGMI